MTTVRGKVEFVATVEGDVGREQFEAALARVWSELMWCDSVSVSLDNSGEGDNGDN